MKKLIALGTLSLGLVLGAAVVHADDYGQNSGSATSNTTTTTTTDQNNPNSMGNAGNAGNMDNSQQAGTAGNPSDANSANTANTMNSASTTAPGQTQSETTTVAKTCTDDSGTSYEKGKKGYKHCMKTMHKKKEMSGTMGSDTTSSSSTSTAPSSNQ